MKNVNGATYNKIVFIIKKAEIKNKLKSQKNYYYLNILKQNNIIKSYIMK